MICIKWNNRFLNKRLWKLSVAKESQKKNKPHGIFLADFFWIKCKPSFMYLWINSGRMIGKGVFSRSEPLLISPNPCYNSLGKAGRDRIISGKIRFNYAISENLQVTLLELLFFSNKFEILTQLELNMMVFKTIIQKISIGIFPLFLQYRNFLLRLLDLKSGLKFSGNFLIYKKKKKNV